MITVASIYAPRREHELWMDYVPLLRLQKASVERLGCRHVVITDVDGDLEFGSEFKTHVVLDAPRSLMHFILRGLEDYLDRAPAEHDGILLCGADGLLCRDPAPLFADMAAARVDCAFTTHPFGDCILNMGAQFIAAHMAPLVRIGYEKAVLNLMKMPAGGHRWGDDQLAFAEVWQPVLEYGDYVRRVADWDIKVRFLPVPGYNDAPENAADLRGLPMIAHFRNQRRKSWMAAWARQHLGIG